MLEAFSLLVILVLCAGAIWLLIVIGSVPGNIARAANHPQAEAINVLAWIGLLTAGIGWFAALVWAKTQPFDAKHDLEERVTVLEARVQQLGGEP